MSDTAQHPVMKLTRRHVLRAGAVIGVGCGVGMAGVASAQRRGAEPTGQAGEILSFDRTTSYDLSVLRRGEMAVFRDGRRYIGVVHRTGAQINAAQNSNQSMTQTSDDDITQDERFLVVNLRCEHRGCQVGYTGDADAMFQCPCHRTTFDAAGRVLPQNAKTDRSLAPVAHRIDGNVVTFL